MLCRLGRRAERAFVLTTPLIWIWGQAPGVVWAIAWLASMTPVMGWLARSRLRPVSRIQDGFVLRYSGTYLALGLVCTFLFLGLAVLSAYAGSSHSEKIKLSLAFIAFSMLGWPIVAGYFIESPEDSDPMSWSERAWRAFRMRPVWCRRWESKASDFESNRASIHRAPPLGAIPIPFSDSQATLRRR